MARIIQQLATSTSAERPPARRVSRQLQELGGPETDQTNRLYISPIGHTYKCAFRVVRFLRFMCLPGPVRKRSESESAGRFS